MRISEALELFSGANVSHPMVPLLKLQRALMVILSAAQRESARQEQEIKEINGEENCLIITGMEHFQSVCKKKLVEWYNAAFANGAGRVNQEIDLSQVFVVWSVKVLQNYKALLSTTVSGDGIYVEYTYNGDKQELYEDVYFKATNTKITEE
jgi:hypothetical protein